MQVDDLRQILKSPNVRFELAAVKGAIGDEADPDGEQMLERAVLGHDAPRQHIVGCSTLVSEAKTCPDLVAIEMRQAHLLRQKPTESALS